MIRPWISLTLLALTFQPATPGVTLDRGMAAPALLRADPPSGAALRQSPRTVDLLFSTPLDARRSFVSVISDAMDLVNSPATVTGRRHDELRVALPKLPAGPYAVVWTAVTPGGAVAHRSYLFTVGSLGPPLLPNRPVELTQQVNGLSVTLRAPSDRVAHQTYTITVGVGGRPVDGARVELTGRSLDMDMGETEATARAAGHGRYVATLDVVMALDWQVTVTIRADRHAARAVFTYLAHY